MNGDTVEEPWWETFHMIGSCSLYYCRHVTPSTLKAGQTISELQMRSTKQLHADFQVNGTNEKGAQLPQNMIQEKLSRLSRWDVTEITLCLGRVGNSLQQLGSYATSRVWGADKERLEITRSNWTMTWLDLQWSYLLNSKRIELRTVRSYEGAVKNNVLSTSSIETKVKNFEVEKCVRGVIHPHGVDQTSWASDFQTRNWGWEKLKTSNTNPSQIKLLN